MPQLEMPLPAHRPNPHAVPVAALLAEWGGDTRSGLSDEQVTALRSQYGYNQLDEAPAPPLWRKLLAQFKSLVVWILVAAAIVSGALGEWTDTLAILAIVLLNAVIGFFQEER